MLDPKSAAEPSPVERRLSVNRTLRRATRPEKDEHGASATVVQLREPAATLRRLRNENLALAVPGLGHLVSDLGLVSKLGGRQRANSLVGGSSPSANSVRIQVVACRIFHSKLSHTWRLMKPFSSNS